VGAFKGFKVSGFKVSRFQGFKNFRQKCPGIPQQPSVVSRFETWNLETLKPPQSK
jgi:hypothetical protein